MEKRWLQIPKKGAEANDTNRKNDRTDDWVLNVGIINRIQPWKKVTIPVTISNRDNYFSTLWSRRALQQLSESQVAACDSLFIVLQIRNKFNTTFWTFRKIQPTQPTLSMYVFNIF